MMVLHMSFASMMVARAAEVQRGDGVRCRAKAIMERVFPDRKVVAVPTREILLGGGNIHCITQQQPYRHAGIAPEDKSPEGPAALEPQAKL